MKRKHLKGLNGVVFGVCVLVVGVVSVKAIKLPDQDSPEVLDGSLFRDLEGHYQEKFPVKDWVTGFWATVNYQLFNEGRDGVVVGHSEWLFSSEEYRLPSDYEDQWNNKLDQIVTYDKQLSTQGIELLVVLIPEKVDVYGDLVSKKSMHDEINLYHHSALTLEREGVALVNLRDPLIRAKDNGDKVFYRTDTHWTVKGAEVAARAIKNSGLVPSGEAIYEVEPKGEISFSGDLTNYIPTGDMFADFAPAPETIETLEIVKSGQGELSLFDDSTQSIALVGTSYSADKRWKFVDWLQLHTQQEVLDYSSVGKGPFVPMAEYVSTELETAEDIEMVIWEIPVRYLIAEPTKA
ncbi:alginate O-acetyltransferase AlgX-related protein [Echinimonas agarilytica]|uniref:AlgX/AlgJ SGNH hydrolase-like domain-containing protein n=1 Tax=Echinimonas agarilytica TaxID=1215918 RepID=A0AA41W8I1_9GAMM|nr:hypothetical protein [Echinimonas agarilytica]MCM2681222.1 hypothetical protein [Echinimonas agarilytica]